ncbi:MAG: hypothetical protein ACREBI_07990 [Nitrosotalea sp.]
MRLEPNFYHKIFDVNESILSAKLRVLIRRGGSSGIRNHKVHLKFCLDTVFTRTFVREFVILPRIPIIRS